MNKTCVYYYILIQCRPSQLVTLPVVREQRFKRKKRERRKYLNIKATATWKEMADKAFEKDKRKKKGNLDK